MSGHLGVSMYQSLRDADIPSKGHSQHLLYTLKNTTMNTTMNERGSMASLFRKGNAQIYLFTLNSTH